MDKIRLLAVDDQTVVREGLVAILENYPDIQVVGQAEDGIQAVKLAQQTKPDVILLDMVMPNMDGLTAIPKIKEVAPDARILVVTSFAETDRVYQAIKAGALGYILKDATREQLLQSIRDVAQGRASLQPSIAVKLIQEINHPSELLYTADPLTRRELETLRLIARGLSNQEIAAELVVHERTIAKYVSSILDKLHLANRTQAALYALREGLTDLATDE
ncbi:MAG TPA: response regulator transcription factor [Anaerolineales bacterium]|nr:response regulator transcription factor [Anaerolineales bacterium]